MSQPILQSPEARIERQPIMEEVTKTKEINGYSVFVTKLYGDGEEGKYHVLAHNNDNDKSSVHVGDRASSERFIKDKVKRRT
jgi:hypothetical protein